MPSALKQKRIADPLAVANGGTGSSTAAQARTNLDVPQRLSPLRHSRRGETGEVES